jgi:phosphopentomutase
MLDAIKGAGLDSIAVGKITDIFVGQGITETIRTASNTEGMAATSKVAERDFHGICFTNLVDFDMVYGHRNNVEGYAAALTEFDRWLTDFLLTLGENDLLIITADHGCDPGDESTDHTREQVPFIIYGKGIQPENLGTRLGFATIGNTAADLLGVSYNGGNSPSVMEEIV